MFNKNISEFKWILILQNSKMEIYERAISILIP
jgi:hypothetical protein